MPTLFDSWKAKEALDALQAKAKGDTTGPVAQRFYDGDHWQGSQGWIGQRPEKENPQATTIMAEIQQSFVFENAVKAVVDRHVGGVLGKEPTFALAPVRALKPQEKPNASEEGQKQLGEAALTPWWDTKKILATMRTAAAIALLRRRSVLRLYIPRGLRDQAGTVKVVTRPGEEPIHAALRLIHLDALAPDRATVYLDDDTKREIGIFAYKDKDNREWTELTYLAEDDVHTVLRVLGPGGSDQRADLDLGGRLLMYELEREPLINSGILQLQRVINHTRTIISRNVHMAGFRQQAYLNAAPPGHWEKDGQEVTLDTPGAKWVAGTLPSGAGAALFIQGNPVYDAEGHLSGYTNAAVATSDPVDPTGLITVRDSSRLALLEGCHQLHVAMSGDATATGESRKQARVEYENDLGITAQPTNDMGRWVLGGTLALGSALLNQPTMFSAVRPEFAVRIDAGPIGADEKRENREDFKEGLLSQESAMAANGVADVAAEMARKRAEEEDRQQREDASLLRLSRPGQGAQEDDNPTQDDPNPDDKRTAA